MSRGCFFIRKVNFTDRNCPFGPVSGAGQQHDFQFGALGHFKREFTLVVGGSAKKLSTPGICDDNFARLYFFTAAELALNEDGVAHDPRKDVDPMGIRGLNPETQDAGKYK